LRRRRPIDVWPALADLMTVVAIVGLTSALQFLPLIRRDDPTGQKHLLNETRKLRAQNEKLQSEIREAARNEQMFQAIQRAQEIVDEFSKENAELRFENDQSLQFGEDLVEFELNGLEPQWKGDGSERLWRFCEALSGALSRPFGNQGSRRLLFTVEVEGHTDAILCPDDPHCNWRISSGRAAVFVALMRNETYCPGGFAWTMVPVGLADTRPIIDSATGVATPTRRIAVRLVPNYKALIRASVEGNIRR
jgi:hypothetical protein